MYLLVKIPDEGRVSEARDALLAKGFDQLTTGKEMKDICVKCKKLDFSEETGEELCPPLIKVEETGEESEGIAAEELFANIKEEEPDVDEEVQEEMNETDYNLEEDLKPTTSRAIERSEYGHNPLRLAEGKIRRDTLLKAKRSLKGVGTHRVELLSRHLMRMQRANKDGTSIYYCYFRNRASACCPGAYRIYRYNGSIEVLVPHNHGPNDELNRVELIKSQQKEMAKDKPHLNPKAIIQESWSQVKGNDKKQIGSLLGSYDCQRKRIERARRSLAQKETTEKYWTAKMEEETGSNFLRLGAFLK